MGLLDIDHQAAVPPDAIVIEKVRATRRGKWTRQMEGLRGKFASGQAAPGAYLELARFKSPAGARVKERELVARYGAEFAFICQRYTGADGQRHSSLYGTRVAE